MRHTITERYMMGEIDEAAYLDGLQVLEWEADQRELFAQAEQEELERIGRTFGPTVLEMLTN